MDKKKKVLQLHKRFCDGMGDFFFCFSPFLSFVVFFKVDINIAKEGSDNIGTKTERKLEFSTGKPAKITPQGIRIPTSHLQ